jgi:hypothetical protein
MKTKLIARIYRTLQAMDNCTKDNKPGWCKNHSYYLDELEKNYLPHGSGIDSGCTIDREFKKDCVIINVPYHNMDENGYYCGWSEFKVICKPEFDGIYLKITGKDKYYVKDYLYSVFANCLEEEMEFLPAN